MAFILDLLRQLTRPTRSEVPHQGLITSAREVASSVPTQWTIVFEFEYMGSRKRDNLTLWATGEEQARKRGQEKIAYCGGVIVSVSRIV